MESFGSKEITTMIRKSFYDKKSLEKRGSENETERENDQVQAWLLSQI